MACRSLIGVPSAEYEVVGRQEPSSLNCLQHLALRRGTSLRLGGLVKRFVADAPPSETRILVKAFPSSTEPQGARIAIGPLRLSCVKSSGLGERLCFGVGTLSVGSIILSDWSGPRGCLEAHN